MIRPWMPLYVADYLADTAHLNAAEHGAYLLLIMHYWTKGGLPENEEAIRRITRMTARQWSQSRDVLRSLFGDHWCHKRVDHELAQATEISRKRSASAHQKHSKSTAKALQLDTHSLSPSQEKKDAANAAPEADLYRRGKQVLGSTAGGLIKQLLAVKEGKIPLARAVIETASTKQDPREYVNGAIRGRRGEQADQQKLVEQIRDQKRSAVVFADEVPGGIPGIE